jgi:hypothetical protein
LFGFQGLGIVSNNKKLMKKIKEYTPWSNKVFSQT